MTIIIPNYFYLQADILIYYNRNNIYKTEHLQYKELYNWNYFS